MLGLGGGISILGLLVWNVYLVASGQTAVEFAGNRIQSSALRLNGEVFANPYDLGTRQNLRIFFNVSEE